MHVEIICSKCNHTIYRMKVLRAIKDILRNSKRCPECNSLLMQEFSIMAEKV